MTETVIKTGAGHEIDEELLVEAQRQIGAASPNSAINEALRRLVEQERAKRRQALERAQQMSDEGLFDYSALDAAEQ
jgi:Arc/MetJ family transcription regulator